jgi:hypothetical protein
VLTLAPPRVSANPRIYGVFRHLTPATHGRGGGRGNQRQFRANQGHFRRHREPASGRFTWSARQCLARRWAFATLPRSSAVRLGP